MKNILRYKEYVGSVEISETDGLLFGRVLGIQEKVTYQAVRADELVKNFHQAVDVYLEQCKKMEFLRKFRTRAASTSGFLLHCIERLRFMRYKPA